MPTPSFLSSNPRSLVNIGQGAPVMNAVHPLTPVSNHLGLDGIHTTPSEVGHTGSGGTRKRNRETGLSQVQQSPFGSPAARSMPTLHEQHYSRPHGSPDGTTPYLLLMVADTCPIRLQQPIVHHRRFNNEGSKPIPSLSWVAQDMKRTSPRRP